MRQVPIYALYGDASAMPEAELVHCETIAVRSRLHGFRINPHRHGHLMQLLFLSGGHGEVAIDGAVVTLTPPCLVLLPPLVVHGYSFSNDVEGLVLTLYQRQLALVLRSGPEAAVSFAEPWVLKLADDPERARMIGASLAALAVEFAGSAPGRLAMMEAHLAIVCLAAHRARIADRAGVSGVPARGIDHVVRFQQMIDREFRAHLSVEAYAQRLGMTPVHLRRLCRAHLGTSPLGAVSARLVLEAKRMLVFTSLGVKEVAAAIGFADHAYFTRFFQRETGLTPTAFRARRQMTPSPPETALPRHSADTHPATGRSAA